MCIRDRVADELSEELPAFPVIFSHTIFDRIDRILLNEFLEVFSLLSRSILRTVGLLPGVVDVYKRQSFNLPKGRSLGFASTSADSDALFRLAFASAPGLKPLASPATVTRRFIMQKARPHSITLPGPLEGT